MAKISDWLLDDLDREEATEEGISDNYINRIRKEEKEMRLYEIKLELARGNALRHKSWAPDCYICRHFSRTKGYFIVTKFNANHTTPFSLCMLDDYSEYDYEIYTSEIKTDKDKFGRVMDRLARGDKLTRPHWKDAFIYREARKDSSGHLTYRGPLRLYWVQENGNIYNEPYEFGKFDDLILDKISDEEVRRIWGYYPGEDH